MFSLRHWPVAAFKAERFMANPTGREAIHSKAASNLKT
jgi:hypothetical protein